MKRDVVPGAFVFTVTAATSGWPLPLLAPVLPKPGAPEPAELLLKSTEFGAMVVSVSHAVAETALLFADVARLLNA